MSDRGQRNIGRSLPIQFGLGLLIVAGGLVFLRNCGETEDFSGLEIYDEPGEMQAEANPEVTSKPLTAKQVPAKVRSLLAVEEGEVAVISLPEGALEKYFQFTEPDDTEKAKPGIVRGLEIENHGRDQLESILMDGGELSGHVREIGKHVVFPNVGMRVAIGTGLAQNLDLMIGDETGRTQLKTSIPAQASGELILRSAYPNPKAVLIVLKRNQIEDGK